MSDKVDRLEKARQNRKESVKGRREAYSMDHLIAVVQLRMSNELGQVIPKNIIKSYIENTLLSIIDLAKDEIPVVLLGILRAESYTTIGGANSVKFRISKTLRNTLNSGTILDDSNLKSLEDIAINQKVDKYKSTLIQSKIDREKVLKKIENFSQKVLTKDVNNVIMNNVNSINSEELKEKVLKGVDSNEVQLIDKEMPTMVLDSDEDWDLDSMM